MDGYGAGKAATEYLKDLLKWDVPVRCEARTTDRYGRTVAVCYAGGSDLGAQMVQAGMAWAFRRYSLDYVPLEAMAKAARLGVHAHDCEVPWDWRRGSGATDDIEV